MTEIERIFDKEFPKMNKIHKEVHIKFIENYVNKEIEAYAKRTIPTITARWRKYVIKARIEELERIQTKMGTIAEKIFEHFKQERIAELKKKLTP